MTWHDMTSRNWPHSLTSRHLTTNHKISDLTRQPTTSKQVPTSQPWNGWRLVHSKNSVWASQWLVALCTFYRQILSLTYSFFSLKLPPPACPALLVNINIYQHTCFLTIPESQSICHTAVASCLQHPSLSLELKNRTKQKRQRKKMAVMMSAIIQISIETFLAYLALRVSVGSWHRRDLSPRGPVAKLRKLPRLIDVEWGRPKCRC